MAEVFAAFGQPAQNRALVFGADGAQILLPEGSDGKGERIGRVTLPAIARGVGPDFHGKCRGDIGNGLAAGNEDLGNSAAQAVGAFDSESAGQAIARPSPAVAWRCRR
nr:hypothetical protein [Arthrobacter sp. efr-133-TYG-120]